MRLRIMQAIVDPVYFKRTQVISPGVVGSVGDTLGGVRLKQSAPDMPMRYEAAFAGKKATITGSNVQDGYSYSYSSGGGSARTVEGSWASRGFKTNHGWVYQDLRAPDTTLEPVMGSTGRYNWYNKIATIYEAKRTGDLFLPLPGPYGPTSVTRGSQVPRITDTITPTDLYTKFGDQREQPKKPITETTTGSSVVKGYRCIDAEGNITIKSIQQAMQNTPSVVTNQDRPQFSYNPATDPNRRELTADEQAALQNLNFGGGF